MTTRAPLTRVCRSPSTTVTSTLAGFGFGFGTGNGLGWGGSTGAVYGGGGLGGGALSSDAPPHAAARPRRATQAAMRRITPRRARLRPALGALPRTAPTYRPDRSSTTGERRSAS